MAASHGHQAIVELFLQNGVDLKDRRTGAALLEAIKNGRESIVKILLANGADLDTECQFRGPPLVVAACHGHEAMVKLLLAEGVDPDAVDALIEHLYHMQHSWGTRE